MRKCPRTGEFPLSELGSALPGLHKGTGHVVELGGLRVEREGLILHILNTALKIYAKYPSTLKILKLEKKKESMELKQF